MTRSRRRRKGESRQRRMSTSVSLTYRANIRQADEMLAKEKIDLGLEKRPFDIILAERNKLLARRARVLRRDAEGQA